MRIKHEVDLNFAIKVIKDFTTVSQKTYHKDPLKHSVDPLMRRAPIVKAVFGRQKASKDISQKHG